jgi:hypothetical protein
MRIVASLSLFLLAACPITPDSAEPTQPPPPDATAAVADAPPAPRTEIAADDHDRYCTRDDECVAAFEGNACDPCRTANTAIRRDALPRNRAELGAYWACYEPEACEADGGAAIGDPAICVANKCTLPAP